MVGSDIDASDRRDRREKAEHRLQRKTKEKSERKHSKRDKAEKSAKVRHKDKHKRHKARNQGSIPDAHASHELLQHELLSHAAMGCTKLLRQLLDGCNSLDLNAFDARGASALHHACHQGHLETAALLLQRGADIDAEDFSGDTPAHLAATHGHLQLLTYLLQAEPAPHIERRNARGVSVRQLTESVMGHRDVRSWDAGDKEELSPEDAWRQRLAEEAECDFGGGFGGSTQDRGAEPEANKIQQEEVPPNSSGGNGTAAEDWTEWGSWEWYGASGDGRRMDGSNTEGAGLQGGAIDAETEDDFAQRIWLEMERRRQQQQQSTSNLLKEERRQTEEKRKFAEGEAYQRSRKILEEEISKDRTWREAVQQGDASSRRAQYEARWHSFVTVTAPGQMLSMIDVPWITEDTAEHVKAIILCGTSGKAEEKKRLRLEQMRWHPDKFIGKFGGRLAPRDRDKILTRVTQMSQLLNALAAD